MFLKKFNNLKNMCLAIPGKILEINNKKAKVDFGGVRRIVDLILCDEIEVGEYVLVHVGFAIQRVDEEVARQTYRLLYEMRKEELEEELNKSE